MPSFLFGLHESQIFRVSDFRFFPAVSIIVAHISPGSAVVKLYDLGDDPVQEIAVMGDDEDCPLIIHEVGLQPDN